MGSETEDLKNPKPTLIKLTVVFVLCFIIGAVFYHLVEGYSYIDAIYFTAMTLTTVGYGDFTPITPLGKLFTAAYAFVGVGTFLGFAAILFQVVLHRHHTHHKK
jgi:voltage-gated potassium channel